MYPPGYFKEQAAFIAVIFPIVALGAVLGVCRASKLPAHILVSIFCAGGLVFVALSALAVTRSPKLRAEGQLVSGVLWPGLMFVFILWRVWAGRSRDG
jgi:hypothetical protein